LSNGFANLMETLRRGFDFSGQKWVTDNMFLDLFVNMLNMNPG